MPNLSDLLAGQTSFDEIRRRGVQGTSLDNQQELQSQAMRNAQARLPAQGFPPGMYQQVPQPQQPTLMDILRRLSTPQQPGNGFMGVRG